jgi:hypothetical protein
MIKFNKEDSINQNDNTKKYFSKFDTIMWSLGIGDFLSLDSYIPDFFYKKLKNIFLFTSSNNSFEQLIRANKNYDSVKIIFADNKFDKGEIYEKEDYLDGFFKKYKLNKASCFHDNLSIWNLPEKNNKPKISSFFNQKLCDIKFDFLNDNYCVIFPNTKNTRDRRFFTSIDWIETAKILKFYKFKGVVLGNENFKIPKLNELIDLNNKTSILESIEITKNAKMYIGIDSFLSTFAMQVFENDKIYIKSTENHLYDNLKFFCPFKKNIDFVNNKIKIRDKRIRNLI